MLWLLAIAATGLMGPALCAAGGTDSAPGPKPSGFEIQAPLPALARASFAAGRPLVVMFSLRGCPWCEALRREHFARLIADQQALGITAIELDLMDERTIDDDPAPAPSRAQPADRPGLAQAATPSPLPRGSAREPGHRYRVRFAPTILFLGPEGEIAQPLVGYGSPDFFGAYLEQRIEQARAAIRPR